MRWIPNFREFFFSSFCRLCLLFSYLLSEKYSPNIESMIVEQTEKKNNGDAVCSVYKRHSHTRKDKSVSHRTCLRCMNGLRRDTACDYVCACECVCGCAMWLDRVDRMYELNTKRNIVSAAITVCEQTTTTSMYDYYESPWCACESVCVILEIVNVKNKERQSAGAQNTRITIIVTCLIVPVAFCEHYKKQLNAFIRANRWHHISIASLSQNLNSFRFRRPQIRQQKEYFFSSIFWFYVDVVCKWSKSKIKQKTIVFPLSRLNSMLKFVLNVK